MSNCMQLVIEVIEENKQISKIANYKLGNM